MSDMPDLPDLPDPEELKDRLSRFVAVATVVTTLIGAVVGFLLASAARGDDLQDVTAQRLAARAAGQLLRAQHRAQADYQNFVLAEEQRRRAASATIESLFVTGEEERRLQLEQKRWERVAERTQELTSISRSNALGPEQDTSFPLRFFTQNTKQPVRLGALQDAANDLSAVYEGRVARYTAVLTLFAVALYLFGLSFTLQPKPRRLFAVTGTALLLGGTIWAASEAFRPARPAPEAAAESFAEGHVVLQTASGPEDYRAAVRHFDRAVRLRPGFARALAERAQATFLAGSPQRTGFTSVTSPQALARAIADLRAAIDNGIRTGSVRASLGFYLFLQGVREGVVGLLDESVGFTQEAIALDPGDPVLRFNLGVAHLAAGRLKEAPGAYADGVARVLYTDVEKEVLRGTPALEEQWVAGALSDLEQIVRAGDEDLTGAVREMKEFVVGSASLGAPGVGETAVEATETEVNVFPAELQWQARMEGLDTETDVVSAQWYQEAPGDLGWTVLPEPSGIATLGVEEDGRHFGLTGYLPLTLPHRCLPAGRYRVEIYVNGRLVGEAEQESTFDELVASVDRDLAVGFCRPPDWEPTEAGLPGILSGDVAPDGLRGVYIMRLEFPGEFDDLPAEDRARAFIGQVPGTFPSLFPAPPSFVREEDTRFFMGLEGPVVQRYAYDGGEVLIGAGIDEDGAVVVGLVFAPAEDFEGDAPYQVYDSLVRLG